MTKIPDTFTGHIQQPKTVYIVRPDSDIVEPLTVESDESFALYHNLLWVTPYGNVAVRLYDNNTLQCVSVRYSENMTFYTKGWLWYENRCEADIHLKKMKMATEKADNEDFDAASEKEEMKSPKNPSEESQKWMRVEVGLFHTNIFLCIGSRMEMIETGEDALLKFGFDKSARDDIGCSLATVIPDPLLHVNSGECVMVATKAHGTVHFIRLDELRPGVLSDALVLSHECLHAAINVLDSCGVAETDNHECLCYLHEYIFGIFLKESTKCFNKESKSEAVS